MPGHPAPDGRWQRGEQLAGLYLAQDPETVWAEWYRALAELGAAPDTWLPRDLWRFSLSLQRVADLSRRAALRALGLPDSKPDRAQWPVFQDVGAQLSGISDEVLRSARHLDIGDWKSMTFETEAAVVAMAPAMGETTWRGSVQPICSAISKPTVFEPSP